MPLPLTFAPLLEQARVEPFGSALALGAAAAVEAAVAVAVAAVAVAGAAVRSHDHLGRLDQYTTARPSKRPIYIPLCLGLEACCTLVQSALHCSIRKRRLHRQHLLRHLPGSMLSCRQHFCRLPF